MDGVRAVLIDIDGVLTVSWKPLPGAVEAVKALRSADLPFALVTNTTSRTRARIAETLADAGFPVGPDDVHVVGVRVDQADPVEVVGDVAAGQQQAGRTGPPDDVGDKDRHAGTTA